MRRLLVIACSAALATSAHAQQVGSLDSTFADGVLVTSGDVLTCPYKFVGPVRINVTEDYGGGKDRTKLYAKLRNEAKSQAADAVVLVQRGGSHMSAFAFSRREWTGRAIRYVDRSCAPKE